NPGSPRSLLRGVGKSGEYPAKPGKGAFFQPRQRRQLSTRSQLFLDERHQLTHLLCVEDQTGAGCLEQSRQRTGATEGKRASVGCYGAVLVRHAVAPHLQGSQLRNPVLDVVEGMGEEVGLGQPARDPELIKTTPVNARLKPLAELQPLPVARIAVVTLTACVDPVLERVHARDMSQHYEDGLEVGGAGALLVLRGEEPTRLLAQVGAASSYMDMDATSAISIPGCRWKNSG